VELAGTIDPEEVIAKIAPTRVQEEEEVPAAAEAGALPAAGAEGPPEVEAGSEEP
jgi:hypothetical protein